MCCKELGLAVVHDVEPPVAAHPGEQSLHHPTDPVWQETPVPRAARRDRDMDVVREGGRGEGCAPECPSDNKVNRINALRGIPALTSGAGAEI